MRISKLIGMRGTATRKVAGVDELFTGEIVDTYASEGYYRVVLLDEDGKLRPRGVSEVTIVAADGAPYR